MSEVTSALVVLMFVKNRIGSRMALIASSILLEHYTFESKVR